MAITKIHAVKVRLGDAINYIENPDKTDGQEILIIHNKFLLLTLRLLQPRLFAQDLIRSKCLIQ